MDGGLLTMDEFKLIVAGGRDFTDAKMLDKAILDLAEILNTQ